MPVRWLPARRTRAFPTPRGTAFDVGGTGWSTGSPEAGHRHVTDHRVRLGPALLERVGEADRLVDARIRAEAAEDPVTDRPGVGHPRGAVVGDPGLDHRVQHGHGPGQVHGDALGPVDGVVDGLAQGDRHATLRHRQLPVHRVHRVEVRAEHQQQVALGKNRPHLGLMHGDVDQLRVTGEQATPGERGHHDRSRPLRQPLHGVLDAGRDHATAEPEDDPVRRVDQTGDSLDRGVVDPRRRGCRGGGHGGTGPAQYIRRYADVDRLVRRRGHPPDRVGHAAHRSRRSRR
jgi:hypothetical protein